METSSELQTVSTKERIKLVLKFLLVGVVFWFLFKKGLVTAQSFNLIISSPITLFTIIGLVVLNTFLGALRWQGLLAAREAPLLLPRVLQLNMIGAFFNIALPGAVSGDFVKAVYVAKQFPEKRSSAFGSMFMDRLLGSASMVFVAAASALVSTMMNWGGSLPQGLMTTIGVIAFLILVFFLYMFSSHKRDPLFELIQWFTRRSPRLIVIDKLYLSIMDYRAHPKVIFKAVAQSMLIHTCVVIMAFTISEAVCTTSIPFIALAIVVPIGILATAIPVLPAGVGTGHAAFFALFKLIGSDQGAEVFSLIVLTQIIVGLIGGVVYLRSAKSN